MQWKIKVQLWHFLTNELKITYIYHIMAHHFIWQNGLWFIISGHGALTSGLHVTFWLGNVKRGMGLLWGWECDGPYTTEQFYPKWKNNSFKKFASQIAWGECIEWPRPILRLISELREHDVLPGFNIQMRIKIYCFIRKYIYIMFHKQFSGWTIIT